MAAQGLGGRGLRALELRLGGRGTQAWLSHSVSDLPGPGIEPVSPELALGFTEPPGKP